MPERASIYIHSRKDASFRSWQKSPTLSPQTPDFSPLWAKQRRLGSNPVSVPSFPPKCRRRLEPNPIYVPPCTPSHAPQTRDFRLCRMVSPHQRYGDWVRTQSAQVQATSKTGDFSLCVGSFHSNTGTEIETEPNLRTAIPPDFISHLEGMGIKHMMGRFKQGTNIF